MKIAAITAACAALVAMAGTAEAANAPAELLNKTISVGWLVNANGVTAAGKQLTGWRSERTIYVSSQGRVFMRAEFRGAQGPRYARTGTFAPEQTSGRFRFEGNRLIGILAHYMTGGAAQLSISFDSGYHGCTASVQYGHETGKTMKIPGLDGQIYTITGAPSASGASCSIREGNAFAQ